MISFKQIGKGILALGFLAMMTFQSCKKYSSDEPLDPVYTPTIYMGTNNDVLYAIDVETGKYKWKTNLNGTILGSPTYAFNQLFVGTKGGHLYKINYRTGEIIQHMTFAGDIVGAPMEYNEYLLVTAGTAIYALDPSDITDMDEAGFMHGTGSQITGGPAVHEVEGLENGPHIFYATSDNKVIAINNEGEQEWSYTATGGNGFHSQPSVTNSNYLYIGNRNGKMYSIKTLDGSLHWSYQTDGPIESSPILVDGNVLFGSHDRNLYSVDSATGLIRWKYQTEDLVTSSPAFYDQKVYFGSHDKYVYCIDVIDGELIWKHLTFGLIKSSPVVYEKDVYIASYDKNLYRLDGETGNLKWTSYVMGQMLGSPIIRGMNHTAVSAVSGEYEY